MPRKKVLVAINTLTSIQSNPYTDHMRAFYRMGRDYKKFDFFQMVSRRMSIDRFRNMAAKQALEHEVDYLMFIDDDMQIPYDAFIKMYNTGLDICGALTYIRGYPFEIMAFKFVKEDKVSNLRYLGQDDVERGQDPNITKSGIHIHKSGAIRCDAIGTSLSLINVKNTIKKIPPPWFVTGPHNTEDIYFCMKVKDYTKKKATCGINIDLITGHLLDPEVISHGTRAALMAYYESFMDQSTKDFNKCKGDRAEGYVEEIEKLV